MAVLPDVAQAAGHALVRDGQNVAALAGNDSHGRNADGMGGRRFAVHQIIQQFRAAIAQRLQIRVHAGNGRAHGIRRRQIIFRADDGDLFGNGDARALTRFEHIQRLLIVCGKNRERLGRPFHFRREPVALLFPFITAGRENRRLVPAEPGGVVSGAFQGVDEPFAALLVGPVVHVAVKKKIGEAAGQKMVGHQLRGVCVIFQHPGKFQLRTPQTEIHRRLVDGLDKFGEVVARAKPRQDAIAFPAPGDHLFPGQIGVKMPAVLPRKFLNALMQLVIIPAKCQQDALLSFGHGSASRLKQTARIFKRLPGCGFFARL